MGKTLISLFLTADLSVHPCIHMPKSIMYGFKTSPKWEKLSGTKKREEKQKAPGFFIFFIIFVLFKNVHICLINASPSPSPPSTTSEAHFMLLVWNNKVLQALDCIVCRRPLFIALTVLVRAKDCLGDCIATRSSEGATHRKGLGAAKIAFVSSHNLLYCNILLFLYIFCHTKGNHLHLHICCTQNQGIFIAFHIAISVTTLLF